MTEQEILERGRKLLRRYDNMRIIGARGEWSGSARQGFAFNPKRGGGSIGVPSPPPFSCPTDLLDFITLTFSGLIVNCGCIDLSLIGEDDASLQVTPVTSDGNILFFISGSPPYGGVGDLVVHTDSWTVDGCVGLPDDSDDFLVFANIWCSADGGSFYVYLFRELGPIGFLPMFYAQVSSLDTPVNNQFNSGDCGTLFSPPDQATIPPGTYADSLIVAYDGTVSVHAAL